MTKVTREMIAAAHDVTMQHKIMLGHELLTEIYQAMTAKQEFVGLTDVEWMNIVNKDHAWFGQRPEDVAHEVAKLVEAKLREKNA